ncbi:MAG: hypothetical protein MHM6MM_000947 [Cercozoa sp. M6MM]
MPKRAVERFAFFACAVGAGAAQELEFEQQQLQLKFEQQQLQLEFELQRYRELPLCRRLLTEPPSASELVEAAKNTRPE